MNTSWPLANLSSVCRCEFLNFSLKFSRIPFINSTSSAITGRNPNWRDNLCPTKFCGHCSDWLKPTTGNWRVQPWVRGRSAGSFPEQRLVIEPNKDIAKRKHTYLFYGNVNCTSKLKRKRAILTTFYPFASTHFHIEITSCCAASVASEQQHKQDLRRNIKGSTN